MRTLLIVAWLVPCVPVAARIGEALRRSWTSRAGRAPVHLPMQRRGT